MKIQGKRLKIHRGLKITVGGEAGSLAVDDDQGWPYTQRSMMERKTPVMISGVWQFLRFIVLVTSAILFLNPRLNIGGSVLIVMLAAPSLLLAIVCLLGGTNRQRFFELRGVLVFGKLLEILPGFLLLLLQGGAMYFGIFRPVFDDVLVIDELLSYAAETEWIFYYLLAGVVLVDLIFLLVLLSYKKEPGDPEPARFSASGENLPEYRTDEIEEE